MRRLFIIVALMLISAPLYATTYYFGLIVSGPTSTPTPSPTPTPPIGPQFYVDSSFAGYNGSSPPIGACAIADTGAGTLASPYCTLGKAMAAQASYLPDTHINLKRGDVWTETVTITNLHGTSGHSIFFTNYGSGALPAIDGQGVRTFNVVAHNTTAKYITFDGIEFRNATDRALTFWATAGNMPGITLQNSYVHNNGGGAYPGSIQGKTSQSNTVCTNSPPAGPGPCDPGGYANSGFDFEDTVNATPQPDGPQVLNTVFTNQGGHNVIQIHHNNSNGGLISGNQISGCVHNCIDVKGVGNSGSRYIIDSNVTDTLQPFDVGNKPGCFYTQNEHNPNELIQWSRNVCYGSSLCFQVVVNGDPCTISSCLMDIVGWNNTCVAPITQTLDLYISGTPANWTTMLWQNNITDGGNVGIGGSNWTGNHNDRGGKQGQVSNDSPVGTGDITNVDPLYVNFSGNNYQIVHGSPVANAGVPDLVDSLTSMGAYNAP